jgi:ATP synthase subunit 6
VFAPALTIVMFFFAYLRGYNNFIGRSILLHTRAIGANALRKHEEAHLIFIFLTAGDLLEQFVFSANKLNAIWGIFALLVVFVWFVFLKVIGLIKEFVWGIGLDVNQDNVLLFMNAWIIFVTIFIVVLFSNMCGLLPFALTLTSSLVGPFFISIALFFSCFYILLLQRRTSSLAGFLPTGSDLFVAPLLSTVEVISYAAKFISLAVRLFANMFAGHLLLKVFYTICYQVILVLSSFFVFIEICSFSFASSITVLEIMIAVLQAFVMLLLSALYFKEAHSFIVSH